MDDTSKTILTVIVGLVPTIFGGQIKADDFHSKRLIAQDPRDKPEDDALKPEDDALKTVNPYP